MSARYTSASREPYADEVATEEVFRQHADDPDAGPTVNMRRNPVRFKMTNCVPAGSAHVQLSKPVPIGGRNSIHSVPELSGVRKEMAPASGRTTGPGGVPSRLMS